MFLYTWMIDLANSGFLPIQFPFAIYITLGWGFIFASVLMTWLTLGRETVITLLKRYMQWRAAWKWYLAAIFLEPVFIIAAVYINAALTQTPPDFHAVPAYKLFGTSANLALFVLPFALVEIITNGEEIGWRGYVLPRLQAKYSALASTLTLGVVWGFWHLPKFLSHFDAVAFGWFMVHIMSYAVILTWLYNNTKGSLLIVTLSHAFSNTAGIFMPMANTVSSENMGSYIIYALLEVLVAVVIIIVAGPARLSRTEPKQRQSYEQASKPIYQV